MSWLPFALHIGAPGRLFTRLTAMTCALTLALCGCEGSAKPGTAKAAARVAVEAAEQFLARHQLDGISLARSRQEAARVAEQAKKVLKAGQDLHGSARRDVKRLQTAARSVVRAQRAAAQVQSQLLRDGVHLATAYLGDGRLAHAFADLTHDVAVDTVCATVLDALTKTDLAQLGQEPGGRDSILKLAVTGPIDHSVESIRNTGYIMATGPLVMVHSLVQWGSWAQSVSDDVQQAEQTLSTDRHRRAPLTTIIESPDWVTSRAFVEYVQLCLKPPGP
jgi:hypothetical protein